MKKEIADLPVPVRILVSDSNGKSVLSAGAYQVAPNAAVVSERRHFKRAAAGDRGLIFEGPVKSLYADEWVILMARRLEDRKGDFLGDVSVAIPIGSFVKLFSALDYVDRGTAALRTDEGVLVARYPADSGARGATGVNSLSDAAKALLREHPEQDHAVYTSVSSVDGIQRISAYRKLQHAPFLVVVGQPKDDLDQPSRRLAFDLGLFWLLVTIAALWVGRRLHASAVLLSEDNSRLEKRVADRTAEIETKNRALVASEQRFRDTMASAPYAMILFTRDGRILEINAALCNTLGYRREELVGLNILSLVAPEERRPDLAAMSSLVTGAVKTLRFERRFLHKEGRRVPFQVEASVARTASGEADYFIAQGQDISERLAYEQRLEALFDTSVDGVCIHDLDGAVVAFSQSFADMHGYGRDEVKTLNVSDINAVRSASEVRAAVRRQAHSDGVVAVETRHRRKDGSVIDVEVRMKGVTLGGASYLYASSRDIGERMRMQRLLDAEQRRLRDFSRRTADWFWELDENLNFSYVSEGFKSFNGLSAGELMGLSLPDVFARESLNSDQDKANQLEQLRAREPFRDFERVQVDERGERQWISVSGVPVFAEDGRFAGYRGVASIVTARKRAEQALAESRTLLQSVLDASPYGQALFDANFHCVLRNESYGRILELSADLLDGEPFRLIDQFWFCYNRGDFGDATLEQELTDRLRHHGEVRKARQVENRLSNGRWIELRFLPLDLGHLLVTCFDVTNYKTIESDLRAAKERLETAAAAGVIGVWEYDLTSRTVSWDRAMYDLYGVREDEFESPYAAYLARVHPEDQTRALRVFEGAVESASVAERNFRVVWPDGTVRYLKSFSRPICEPDGKPMRMVGVTYDVTEQTEALKALAEAKAQADAARALADAANRAKSEFLANMSHEIRTPLNAIVGMTELLARSARGEEQAGYVRTLESSARSMLVLLTDLLDLAKIEAGQLELNEIPFTLAEVVENVADTFGPLAKGKGVALTVEPLPDGLPALLGDPIRLGQVLINLVGNALKFTLEGTVTVSVEALERSAEAVRLRVAVRDTGIGIAAENLGKLFAPFVQAEGTTSIKFGGTGLGLAISKQLIALMGGEIGVESEKGKGSAFWFVVAFKAAALAAKGARSADGLGGKRLDGVRILVVDDTETNREVAVKLLALEGAICETVENGRAAIDRLRARPGYFDIVLMDVQMPEMDGMEATRVLRRELRLVDLPVIALTAGAMASQRELALASGMNGFVAKPFRLKDLVAALTPWVRRDPAGERVSGPVRTDQSET